jgi:hypothetical protein
MMRGILVLDDMCDKVALEVIVCTIQLDGLVIIRVNGKLVKSDMHMFGH